MYTQGGPSRGASGGIFNRGPRLVPLALGHVALGPREALEPGVGGFVGGLRREDEEDEEVVAVLDPSAQRRCPQFTRRSFCGLDPNRWFGFRSGGVNPIHPLEPGIQIRS